ncbi:6-hydroxy-D-nicotine oxidase [Diplodia seriata]|uniref:6-hydroxy-D-nicotine oxidase n=1 Tax=Diplodia seriata TaxID=420778 RepID=A0A1S8BEH3_9PEZI|nr:6-hydroxy-D-nicotine oxidase [Diplodia seriata]
MAALQVTWKDGSDTQTYEKARIGRVFNHRRPDRYPIAVVEATEESDIVEAVRLAKEKQCRLSVRSGGHSWAAWSVRDDAILLDLGQYKHIDLDEKTGIVSVSPSTTGRMLNGLLTSKGRLFAGGHCPDVGLGGFLLQGGMGWNCKVSRRISMESAFTYSGQNWGWACEQVVGVDVVTADGEKLHCTEQENSELLWAARGAGPGFPAVVTRFYLQTRPSYSCMRSSAYSYANADFKKAMNWILSVSCKPQRFVSRYSCLLHCRLLLLLTAILRSSSSQAILPGLRKSSTRPCYSLSRTTRKRRKKRCSRLKTATHRARSMNGSTARPAW